MTTTCNRPRVELLQAEVAEDDESYFRILVDGRSVKYITIEHGLYSEEDMCFGPSLAVILPDLPPGDWNDGLVAKNPETGHPHFARAVRTEFPSVTSLWHNTRIDYQDIVVGEKIRTGIYEITCAQFDVPVVAKFARFEWEIQYLENETAAYEWIGTRDICPQFLGHLTEDGRVIGFLMERITNVRHAGPEDLTPCQQALSQIHQLGIRHGDINRFNFLIRGSKAILLDLDTAQKCDDQNALQEEFENLAGSLKDTSYGGGGGRLCVTQN